MSTADKWSSGSSAESAPRRLVFLDALRLLAAFQMIQGHTIDALLAPAFRLGPLFRAWTFTRGLTSTAFLFAAGFAFAVVSDDAQRAERGRRQRLRRGAQLVAIGYLLHAPLGGFFGVAWSTALQQAQVVDVLQCIGVSLWLLELLVYLAKRARVKLALSTALACACFLSTQASQQLVPEGVLSPLLHYFTARGGSLFPLLPWAGYVLAGYALAIVVLPRALARPALLPLDLSLAAGLLLAAASASRFALAAPVYGPTLVAAGFLLLKLGLVVLVSAGLALGLSKRRRLPARLERLSGETLFLYVIHVVILYGTGVGLSTWLGRTLSPFGACAAALLLMLACSASALAYQRGFEALRGRKGRSRPAPQRIGSRGETENHSS